MPEERQPRFTRGELVQYMGTVSRLQGWLFEVAAVRAYSDKQSHYDLRDPVWGLRLEGVRESSLRGPHDGHPQAAATVTDGVAPPAGTAGR